MLTPISQIEPTAWRALPRDIRDHLIREDFKGRLKANMTPRLRVLVRDRLDLGETISIRTVAEEEVARMWREGIVSPVEHDEAVQYVMEQVGGFLSQSRDRDGHRLYLTVDIRTFAHRDHAPESVWRKHFADLASRRDVADARVNGWAELYRARWDRCPDVTGE